MMMRMTTAGKEGINVRRTLARLRPFVLPHWLSISLALLLMLGEAGMDLLKPWPLKLTFDVVLRQKTLEGNTLYLLIGVSALVVAIALNGGLFDYLAAFCLNGRAGPSYVTFGLPSLTTSRRSPCSSTAVGPPAT